MKENIIEVDIEKHFAGDYRLQYDGKYVSLYGRDTNFIGFKFVPDDAIWYEEMVLIPVIVEVRNANPEIVGITKNKIIINLNVQ